MADGDWGSGDLDIGQRLNEALYAVNRAIRSDMPERELKELTAIRDQIWAIGVRRYDWKD